MEGFFKSHTFGDVFVAFLSFFTFLTALFVVIGFGVEKSILGEKRRIYALRLKPKQYLKECMSNIIFCFLISVVAAIFVKLSSFSNSLPFQVIPFVSTFVLCLVSFEVFYYGMHRLFHTQYLFKFHARHHLSRINTPFTALSFSFFEMLGWVAGLVGLPWILSGMFPFSLEGWLAYLTVNFLINIMGHLNVEISPQLCENRLLSWITHPVTYHAIHHARVNRHYCFILTGIDRVFGTEWDDWGRLYKKVTSGRPAQSLTERG